MKIANLAKLEIKEEEVPFYISEMQAMIDFAEAVCTAQTAESADKVKALDFNDMREDEVITSFDSDEILVNAKDYEDGFFKLRRRA
ncbi:MAG: aspartyl/glutamyl-tRNA amidotransferase subunit C [Clostridia bacterium]|nr:aspartyl/glutamyl-tRNA amidotransferase subunit C [Clostridia bacterium]